jgi:glucan 1,3-beta-glucosidase
VVSEAYPTQLTLAPGSQNGYDNSGHKGTIGWNTAANVARTKAIVNTMAVKYSDPSYWQVVTAFNILNEPAGYSSSDFLSTTRQFYYDSYGTSRWPWAEQGNAAKSGLVIVLHDAFQPTSYWSGFMPEPTWEDVMMDTHSYSVGAVLYSEC